MHRIIDKLINRVATKRYINFYFKENSDQNIAKASEIAKIIADETSSREYTIVIDIKKLSNTNENAAKDLVNTFNEQLSKVQFNHWLHDAFSIESALDNLNKRLDKPATLILHYFDNPENAKEIVILKGIRNFIEKRASIYLGVLLFSCPKVIHWDLSPGSNIDHRHFEFFEFREQ